MTPLGVVSVLQYCICVESGHLPMAVRRKVAMLRAFTVGFFRKFKSCLLLLVALPCLTDTLLHSCQLEDSFYECLWRGEKGPWYRNTSTAYHHWLELWHYIYCSVQSESFTVKRNKHPHTHTNTNTHTYLIWLALRLLQSFENWIKKTF